MLNVRRAEERGVADFGWLDSRHTFSFGHYHDPRHMGYGPLRVINEDRVAPGRGFDPHGHRDMEIISYVVEGGLEHRDSMGNGSVIRPGDVQRMSAGTGVRHSEYNASNAEPVHFLQIWIIPEENGLEPGYEQTTFGPDERRGRLRLVGSPDAREGSVTIHQDVDLYAALLGPGETVDHDFDASRIGWIQLVRGSARVNDTPVSAGDGIAVPVGTAVAISAVEDAELLLFDMGHKGAS